MKAGQEHRVPLSTRVLAIIAEMAAIRRSEFVFPGIRQPNAPFAPSSFKDAIKRLEPNGATAHGFRSSFRDWCAECTNFPREVCELALAHRVGDAVEAAYRRSDLLERRRELMEAWAKFCAQNRTQRNVVPSGVVVRPNCAARATVPKVLVFSTRLAAHLPGGATEGAANAGRDEDFIECFGLEIWKKPSLMPETRAGWRKPRRQSVQSRTC